MSTRIITIPLPCLKITTIILGIGNIFLIESLKIHCNLSEPFKLICNLLLLRCFFKLADLVLSIRLGPAFDHMLPSKTFASSVLVLRLLFLGMIFAHDLIPLYGVHYLVCLFSRRKSMTCFSCLYLWQTKRNVRIPNVFFLSSSISPILDKFDHSISKYENLLLITWTVRCQISSFWVLFTIIWLLPLFMFLLLLGGFYSCSTCFFDKQHFLFNSASVLLKFSMYWAHM